MTQEFFTDAIACGKALNTPQREAVTTVNGPLLVYAGAGSGKTMVITHRIAHLVELGVPAAAIMAVTFTNKAAAELKERVANLVGPKSRHIHVSTFHSACVRFLRTYASEIGFTPTFSIFDESEKNTVLKQVIKEAGPLAQFLTPAMLESRIDKLKNRGITPTLFKEQLENKLHSPTHSALRRYGEQEIDELVCSCYAKYQRKLKDQNAMDFNDLLLECVLMLEQNESILQEIQHRFRYFLIDEFQDTNPIQFKLVQLLSAKTRNLCVVGDDDQSIYSWRGAEPEFILSFQKHFPDAKVILLEQNYRSTNIIITAASQVISHNRKRAPKKLWTDDENGELIQFKIATDGQNEAQFVASNILNSIEKGSRLSQVAVLYRTNSQSRLLEDELRRRMIPYVIYGSVRFYERAEIKCLLSYLKLLINPSDDVAFRKIIGMPKRGFGETALSKLQALADREQLSLLRTALRVAENDLELEVSRGLTGLKTLGLHFKNWFIMMQEDKPISEILDCIISDLEFEKFIAKQWPDDFDERWLNVVELRNATYDYQLSVNMGAQPTTTNSGSNGSNNSSSTAQMLAEFLQQAQLVVDTHARDVQSGQADAISMMTIHAAKGLEFDEVFLVGLDEGTLPHFRSLEDPSAIEEERRLMYVAMTRARKQLTISRTREDFYRRELRIPSRFLEEIPLECLTRLDASGFSRYQQSKQSKHDLQYRYEEFED